MDMGISEMGQGYGNEMGSWNRGDDMGLGVKKWEWNEGTGAG